MFFDECRRGIGGHPSEMEMEMEVVEGKDERGAMWCDVMQMMQMIR